MTKIKILLYIFFVLMLFNPYYVFLLLCGLVNYFGLWFALVILPAIAGYWKFWLWVRSLDVELDKNSVTIFLGTRP